MIAIDHYAGVDVTFDRIDIRAQQSLSVDMRAETGAGNLADETQVMGAGVFSLSVCNQLRQGIPIGEIRMWFGGREIRVVGALTGREGVMEVTPDHLAACIKDPDYRKQVLEWLGVSGG